MNRQALPLAGPVLALAPVAADAHSFGIMYTLPIPFWLYLWAAAATLVLSFAIVGVFASGQGAGTARAAEEPDAYPHRLPVPLLRLLQALALLSLAACMVTGWFGIANPYANFNMTFFWIVFLIGFAYLTALVGNLYALVNPWRQMALLIGGVWPGYLRGRWRYPAGAGYWPALVLYGVLIWVELFGKVRPLALANGLAIYTAITLAGIGAFGATAWLRYGEFFGVFLRLIARMAPVQFERADDGTVTQRFRLQWPFSGLLRHEPEHWSLLLFVLFMLSSTAFDGLHQAKPWVELYWVHLYQELLIGWLGSNPVAAFPHLMKLYPYWQTFWLILSPLLYLLAYMIAIAGVRWCAGRRESVRELALRFMPSLLPIVLVYHVTHYYTLVQTQGIKIIALASDPLGRGQNWFGTAEWFRGANVPDMAVVWHVQVALILAGHIVSVYIAHVEALRHYGDRRLATRSQLPMLALMVAFTTAGLWILAQPIKS